MIEAAIAGRVFPAAVIEVGTADQLLWTDALGTLTYEAHGSPTTLDTRFDLASLTKVVATATIAMRLVERGIVTLDSPVCRWMNQWQNPDRRTVTIRDLLEHRAGLPAWRPLFESCTGRDAFVTALDQCALEYEPRTASVYSDLGFILLGWVLETAAGATLDRQLTGILQDVLGPSHAMALTYRPPADWLDRLAPARAESGRGRLLAGDVDDDNAWALGGVAGHAGLFGTAGALGQFARAVMRSLRGDQNGTGALARQDTMRAFVTPSSIPGSSRALGWDTMRPTSSCGNRMSPDAFGHTGFTGTSLWIDPRLGIYVVLLTNRVHPSAGPADAIQTVRRALHDAIVESLV
ncbi:MAG: serine hydrolase [Acidobacteria bacterium]|nr:serine hydrolase [Acidobacteriota bacterium]